MQCFVIEGAGDASRGTLTTIMEDLGFRTEAPIALEQLRDDRRFAEAVRPLVIVPDERGHQATLAEVIDFAVEFRDRAFVIYIAETITPADYKRLVRTGSAEWITLEGCREELREVAARFAAADSTGRAAKIVSFVPSKGGVGTTTLLVEAAVQLVARRKRGGWRAAILDLNLQGGTVADALDLQPRFDWPEIVDRPERLDEQLIDIFTSRFSKGLDVFAGARNRLGPSTVKPDDVFTFIDAIATRYDAILLDLPSQWPAWTDMLLSGSDALVVCGSETVPGLRHLTMTLEHIAALPLAASKIAAAVNGVEVDVLGRPTRRNLIERTLPDVRTFLVSRALKAAGKALDVGKPMSELSPHSKIVRDIKPIAAWIETMTEPRKSKAEPATILREAAA